MSASTARLAFLVLSASFLVASKAVRPAFALRNPPSLSPGGFSSVAQPLSAADLVIRHREEEICAHFLKQNLPAIDRGAIDVGYLNRNVELALRARRVHAWVSAVPFSIFLNNVLPYAR